jgi:hypothetical protein
VLADVNLWQLQRLLSSDCPVRQAGSSQHGSRAKTQRFEKTAPAGVHRFFGIGHYTGSWKAWE